MARISFPSFRPTLAIGAWRRCVFQESNFEIRISGLQYAESRFDESQKTRIDRSIRVFKFYPAGAVQADRPFPFVTGG
jgi:hypothetical protein